MTFHTFNDKKLDFHRPDKFGMFEWQPRTKTRSWPLLLIRHDLQRPDSGREVFQPNIGLVNCLKNNNSHRIS